jgi:hypothetical protein
MVLYRIDPYGTMSNPNESLRRLCEILGVLDCYEGTVHLGKDPISQPCLGDAASSDVMFHNTRQLQPN